MQPLLLAVLAGISGISVGLCLTWIVFSRRIVEIRAQHDAELNRHRTQLESLKTDYAALNERVLARESRIQELGADVTRREQELNQMRIEAAAFRERLADAEARQQESARAAAEKIEELKQVREKIEKDLENFSAKALKSNSDAFIKLAQETLKNDREKDKVELEKQKLAVEQMVKPVHESLQKMNDRIQAFDKDSVAGFSKLDERIAALMQNEALLRKETSSLAEALRKPSVRGAWGEMQLRRAVEFAGMVEHCHFQEQVVTGEGDRPDMVITLPNGHQIIVDSKVPAQAILDALQVEDLLEKEASLKRHVKQIRDRIKELSRKRYSERFAGSADFVVLFLPTEALFSTALEVDSELLAYGAQERVVLATPTTLIALLMSVACGWQQKQVAENARRMGDLAKDLYERIGTFASYYTDMGKKLRDAVNAYNRSVSSMEGRLLVTARRINELGGFDTDAKRLPGASSIDLTPKALGAAELTAIEDN